MSAPGNRRIILPPVPGLPGTLGSCPTVPMDYAVPLLGEPLQGQVCVPPSKSYCQRALMLAALADETVAITTHGGTPGDDVRYTRAALDSIGRWQGGHLGPDRDRRSLDLGWNGTGFRFLIAAACLRPPGARTLVSGRPDLLRRPHRVLVRALQSLGAHVRPRRSGAVRVIAQPLHGPTVDVDGRVSSQYASALALIAPRIGGLTIGFGAQSVSRPYLQVTVDMLRAFGIDAAFQDRNRLHVPAGVPQHMTGSLAIEPDASAAAAWFAAAAYVGGSQSVVGLSPTSKQADMALLAVLEAMGAQVDTDEQGWVRVTGSGARLQGAGEVDLRDATDLVPLVAALAATADGVTEIVGAGHARRKESDRLVRMVDGIHAMGGEAALLEGDVVPDPGGRTCRRDAGRLRRSPARVRVRGPGAAGPRRGAARRGVHREVGSHVPRDDRSPGHDRPVTPQH